MTGASPFDPTNRVPSRRQQQALDYIARTIQTRGFSPTLREIGDHLRIRSTNGVNDLLRGLERKGFIERRSLISRGIALTQKAGNRRRPTGTFEAPSDRCHACGRVFFRGAEASHACDPIDLPFPQGWRKFLGRSKRGSSTT